MSNGLKIRYSALLQHFNVLIQTVGPIAKRFHPIQFNFMHMHMANLLR